MAFVFSACSSTTLPSGGGGGGTGGGNLGGTGGGNPGGTTGGGNLGGMTGGGSTGTSGVIPLPSCLQDLEAACPTDGPCQAPADAGGVVRVCGSKGGCGPDGGEGQINVYKADGSLCYTLTTETSLFAACEYSTYTWTDATGNVVARGSFSATTPPPFVLKIVCVTDAGSNDSVTCDASDSIVTPGCLEPSDRLAHACPCATP